VSTKVELLIVELFDIEVRLLIVELSSTEVELLRAVL